MPDFPNDDFPEVIASAYGCCTTETQEALDLKLALKKLEMIEQLLTDSTKKSGTNYVRAEPILEIIKALYF